MGSEMCIRDRFGRLPSDGSQRRALLSKLSSLEGLRSRRDWEDFGSRAPPPRVKPLQFERVHDAPPVDALIDRMARVGEELKIEGFARTEAASNEGRRKAALALAQSPAAASRSRPVRLTASCSAGALHAQERPSTVSGERTLGSSRSAVALHTRERLSLIHI